MPSDDKQTGTCELCGKSPRVCRQLDSGQWVCHTCLRVFKPQKSRVDPDAPATEKQIAYAHRLGIEVPPGATRRLATKMITLRKKGFLLTDELLAQELDDTCFLHDEVKFYVMDLWENWRGSARRRWGFRGRISNDSLRPSLPNTATSPKSAKRPVSGKTRNREHANSIGAKSTTDGTWTNADSIHRCRRTRPSLSSRES